MDYYHIWFNLKDSHRDLEFAEHAKAFLDHLREKGLIESAQLSRRKLGFGPSELGEFHIAIGTRDLTQLDAVFQQMATRDGHTERLHVRVYSAITDFRSALYRDFPDAVRTARPPSA